MAIVKCGKRSCKENVDGKCEKKRIDLKARIHGPELECTDFLLDEEYEKALSLMGSNPHPRGDRKGKQ